METTMVLIAGRKYIFEPQSVKVPVPTEKMPE